MKKAVFQMETLTCPTCVKKIEAALNNTPGVEKVDVLFNTSKAKIQFDEDSVSVDRLKLVLRKLGYLVLSVKES